MLYDQIEISQQIKKNMRNLKSALGKQDLNAQFSQSSVSRSLQGKKHDTSSSMWSIENQLEDSEINDSIDNGDFTSDLIETLTSYLKLGRDPNQATIHSLIDSQHQHFNLIEDQNNVLQLIERKLLQCMETVTPELENYIHKLFTAIKQMKKNLRMKEQQNKKKAKEFDQIADKLFKKTAPTDQKKEQKKKFIEINVEKQVRPKRKSTAKSSHHHDSHGTKNSGDSLDSGEGKLSKLLIPQKFEGKQSQTITKQKTEYIQNGQNYSFSSVISASMTVKQRESNRQRKEKKMPQPPQQKDKDYDNKATDQGFIFYRPKKGRK